MDSVKNVIVSATSIAALLPAASLLLGLTDLPPDFSDFVKFISGAIGPALVLAVYLFRDRIRELKPVYAAIVIVLSFAAGLALSTVTYWKTQTQIDDVVITDGAGNEETLLFIKPESLSPKLNDYINVRYGGDWSEAIISNRDGPVVRRLIREEALPTQIKMIVYFNLAQIFLIVGLLTLAWRAVAAVDGREQTP